MQGGTSKLAAVRRISRALIAGAAVAAILATSADAAPGQLDQSFGMGGIGGGELGPHYPDINFEAITENPDGTLLATRRYELRRYLADGSLDLGFPPRRREREPPTATQADGKVLVVPESARGTISRLNPDGTLDTSFNGGTSQPGASYSVRAIIPLPSGQILVAGQADKPVGKSGIEYGIGLTRLNADGTLDRGFGGGGVRLVGDDVGTVFLPDEHPVSGLIPQSDGSIMVIGSTGAIRLTAAGTRDPGFKISGPERRSVAGFRMLPGGGIALAGSIGRADYETGHDFFVGHYGPNGAPDPTFAQGRGIATVDLGGPAIAASALWTADGAALIGGVTVSRDDVCADLRICIRTPVLARFEPDGDLDASFDGDGLLELDQLSGPSREYGFKGVETILSRRDDVIAGGGGGPEGSIAFLVAVTATGALNPSFGEAGIVRETDPRPSSQSAGPVAVADDGRLLVAGSTDAGPSSGAIALFRYTPNGAIDTGYGAERGFARLAAIDSPVALAVERSGAAIVLSEEAFHGEGAALMRVTAGGAIDSAFGAGGLVTLGRPRARFSALAVQPDGKVLVAGTSNWRGHRARMLVARLLPSGDLDTGFGNDGFAAVGCRQQARCVAVRIALQPDGRILLAGRVREGNPGGPYRDDPSRMALARIRPDGSPDRSFGDNGVATLGAGHQSKATALALTEKKIVVAGSTRSDDVVDTILLRYLPNGRLDRSFGKRGIVRRRGAGHPSALLPTRGRMLVLIADDGPRAMLSVRRNGAPDPSFVSPRPGKRGKRLPTYRAALQAGKPVIAWTAKADDAANPYRSLVRLARLR